MFYWRIHRTNRFSWYFKKTTKSKLVPNESNVFWLLKINFPVVKFTKLQSMQKLCQWLLVSRSNETVKDSHTGESTTTEWQAGTQAGASFQPAGSSGQDKASLFKTPPTTQRKWKSSPCCLTSPHTETHTQPLRWSQVGEHACMCKQHRQQHMCMPAQIDGYM